MAAGRTTAPAGSGVARPKGPPPTRSRQVIGDVLVVVQLGMIGVCLLLGLLPASFRLGPVLDWAVQPLAGLLLMGLAAVLGGLGAVGLRSNLRIHPVPHPLGRLRTQGIYRWIRHPMYAAVLLGCLGAALVHGRLFALLAVAVLACVLMVKGRFEDQLLQEQFGWEFAVYIQRTPAVLPMPWRTLSR